MDKPQPRTTIWRIERRRLPDGRKVYLHRLYAEGEDQPYLYGRRIEGEHFCPPKPPPEEIH